MIKRLFVQMPRLRGGERHLAVIPAVRAVGSRCEDSGASLSHGCRRLTNRIDRGGFHGGCELRNAHTTTHTKKPKKQVDFFFFFFFFADSRKHIYVYLRGWSICAGVSGREDTHTRTPVVSFRALATFIPQSRAPENSGAAAFFLKSLRLEKEQPSLASTFCVGFNSGLIRQEPQRSSDFKEARRTRTKIIRNRVRKRQRRGIDCPGALKKTYTREVVSR